MPRTMMVSAAGLAALLAAGPVAAATPITPTGSGTVDFRFLSMRAPVTAVLPPGTFGPSDPGYEFPEARISFNGFTVAPTRTGNTSPTAPGGSTNWIEGEVIFGTGANVSNVGFAGGDFAPGDILPTNPRYNRIKFTPASFTNVAPGQDFTLGTFEFQNGSGGGGGFASGGAIIGPTMPT